eukprot:jgi/Botrbrau1/18954/Bobra.0892s0001.2
MTAWRSLLILGVELGECQCCKPGRVWQQNRIWHGPQFGGRSKSAAAQLQMRVAEPPCKETADTGKDRPTAASGRDSGFQRPEKPLPPRSSGLAVWADLPVPLQRSVLDSPSSVSQDRWKLAPTCKLFREVFLEHFEAEFDWLAQKATAALGQGHGWRCTALLHSTNKKACLSSTSTKPVPALRTSLREGQLPDDSYLFSAHFVSVYAPALGELEDDQPRDRHLEVYDRKGTV